MQGALAALLPDGRRLHLQHGPIDLVIEAMGPAEECAAAYAQATARFETVLEELVAELRILRAPLVLRAPETASTSLVGPTACRMQAAVKPHREVFVTPMAAVAGAVADEVLAELTAGRALDRAYVNNGGDIALHLAPGAELTLAVDGHGADLAAPRRVIRFEDRARGIATSGWRGRSFSLGIADAVTVAAATAASADVAATLIANAVDLPGSPKVRREAAEDLAPDNDLGSRLVTVNVEPLQTDEAERALDAGAAAARAMLARGLIHDAALFLGGRRRMIAPDPALPTQQAKDTDDG